MKYKGSYFNMWDAWYLNHGETVHAFHLKSHAGDNWNVGHVYTKDLLHFHKMRDVLETLPEEQYPDDCLGKFTGCAVEKDGTYYLFYTMRDRFRSEKIGLALSEDLEHFTEYPGNPVLTPDPALFVVREKGNVTDCRDLHVVYDPESARYYGYFAAMADLPGRGALGTVGVAESTDLIHWENQRIAFVPPFNGMVEVPNVFRLDGRWYLTLLTGGWYGGKGVTSDPDLSNVTILASAPSPTGPFVCGPDPVFLGGSTESGYTCRCFPFRDKTYVMYIDRSRYGAAISLPKEVRLVDGTPKPCYTPILRQLRTGKAWPLPTPVPMPTAWPWPGISAGEAAVTEGSVRVRTAPYSLQAFRFPETASPSLEIETEPCVSATEAGLVLLCHPQEEQVWGRSAESEYFLSFLPRENAVILYENENQFHPICRRKMTVPDRFFLRVLAMEGQLEVYVNDTLFLQYGIRTEAKIEAGVFAMNGQAEFRNLTVYELEK